jgi:hypothetical protein
MPEKSAPTVDEQGGEREYHVERRTVRPSGRPAAKDGGLRGYC